ncbi:hypothetical protein PVAND_008851 [Polypedilum vanderplanki]|uniref:Uncharacterized protein n=1 Tax=Polypedilum vanderplanki TaxID=319348 RepID=A0A9J6CBM9_POLVA|nr:hypothetical protein PVAND_008851 [Polypedilum vanderplanki]
MRNASIDFCVRKYQEDLRDLEKENFNLKLKVFCIENASKNVPCRHKPRNVLRNLHRGYAELEIENSELIAIKQEKIEIMKKSLMNIKMLEKIQEEVKQNHEIDKRNAYRKIEKLKSQLRNSKRRKFLKQELKINFLEQKITEILSDIERLRKNNADKKKQINLDLLKARLKNSTTEYLNKNLLKIINEQSEIIASLKKSIDATKSEVSEYKMKLDYFSSNDIYTEIDLRNINENEKKNRFPFHNPLFGNIE